MQAIKLCFSLLVLIFTGCAHANLVVSAHEALNYIGQRATVCGYAAQIVANKQYIFLNFDYRYPNQTFTVFITPEVRYNNIHQFEKRKVCALGTVGIYKGKAEMTNPQSLQIVN